MTPYARTHLETQRRICQQALMAEYAALDTLETRVPADVRENHRRTILMRVDHYLARIAKLDTDLARAPN